MKKKMKRDGVFPRIKKIDNTTAKSEVKREKAKQRLVNIKKAQKLKRNFL